MPYLRLDVAPQTTLTDAEVRSLGLIPVFRRDRSVLAAYSPDRSLARLDSQMDSYGKQRKRLAALAKIEQVGPWKREDRTSERLKATRLEARETYTVDLVLLPLDDETPNPQALRSVERFVADQQGQVVDRALERNFTAVRVRMGGQSLEALLDYRMTSRWWICHQRPMCSCAK